MWSYLVAWGGDAVELDACGACRGVWIDAREGPRLAAITHAAHAQLGAGPTGEEGKKPGVLSYLFQLVTMVPIEVWNPVRRRPVVVYSLVAVLAAIFGVELVIQNGPNGVAAANAFIQTYGLVPRNVVHGEGLVGIAGHAFLHASLFHLLGNLYFLWVFGDNVEDRLGRARFVVVYAVAGLVGAAAHVAGDVASTQVMIGASGAIAGLMGAYLVLFPRVKVWVVLFFVRFKVGVVWYFAAWLGLQAVMYALGGAGVAWLAHLGGFGAGAVTAWAVRTAPAPAAALATARPG
jgi:membrane associated rhomboid family serine protease